MKCLGRHTDLAPTDKRGYGAQVSVHGFESALSVLGQRPGGISGALLGISERLSVLSSQGVGEGRRYGDPSRERRGAQHAAQT